MITLFKNARILTMKTSKVITGELAVEDNKIIFIGDLFNKKVELNKFIDHTLLAADATSDQIQKLCNEAIKYNIFRSKKDILIRF